MNLHSVDLALNNFPRVVGVRQGRIAFDLPPDRVTPELLEVLYAGRSARMRCSPGATVFLRRAAPAVPSTAPDRAVFPYAFWLVFGLSLAWSLRAAQVDPGALVSAEARANVWRFVRGTFPPDLSPAFLRLMTVPVLETIQISIAGTALAVLIGLPLGILATSTLTWSGVLHERRRRSSRLAGFLPYVVARGGLSVFRSIPEFVWAFMFVRAVGLGAVPGVLAIGVAYAGMLGKVYSEILESVNPRPLETLHAAGASRLGIVLYALVPQALPNVIAYTLYRWECAIRASAVLGFVGAGGLGQQIELSLRMFQFDEVLTLLGILFVLVAAVDFASGRIRARVA
jgi:phosphonate transport system permease protein